MVQVIAGDDKGKVGRVLSVDEVKHRVRRREGELREAPHQGAAPGACRAASSSARRRSTSRTCCSTTRSRERGTRVGVRVLPDGTRERVSRVSGETIPKAG